MLEQPEQFNTTLMKAIKVSEVGQLHVRIG